MKDLGLLVLRLVHGGLLAGHGAQKLVGAFEGPGPQGTAGMMESLGLTPGHYWGRAAGLAESSGALTALGFLHPLGPIGTISAMAMATAKVHAGKPIWVSAGGAELPAINMAIAASQLLTGPGKLSFDALFGIRLPKTFVALAMLGAAGAVAYGINSKPAPRPAVQQDQAREHLQAGATANS